MNWTELLITAIKIGTAFCFIGFGSLYWEAALSLKARYYLIALIESEKDILEAGRDTDVLQCVHCDDLFRHAQ